MNKTGATRHKKFLKAEKSKTKLKGKKDKELPKGTNVTKTNFKVKKIVIKEQLKKHAQTEALSTRKLNVKELLSRLNHFNAQSRTDALDGLKEIISSSPEILEQSLGPVIQGVSGLILNVEKTVRQAALKVLHLVLSNIQTEKIEPFFDIMSTYLRSAMTHIDNRIQEDSLLFLDILLVCAAEKAAEDFHKIMPNFLDMISKLRTDAKPGRTLTVNLNSQITSVKWRVKVLDRLKGFLYKFAEYNKVALIEKSDDTNTKSFNLNGSNNYPLFNPIYTSICHISCFSTKSSENMLQIDEIDKFRDYIETLMPLLFETWLEASPKSQQSDSRMETVVSEDAALLLKHILEVISTVWELVKFYHRRTPSSNIEDIFCQKYRTHFTQNICNSFPYVTNIRSKQKNCNVEDVVTDPKLTTENLQICYLYIMLNPCIHITQEGKLINTVMGYIERVFGYKSNENISRIVFKILQTMFSKEVTGWTRTTLVMDSLFKKIIEIYFNKEETDIIHQQIFTLLCTIAMNDKLSHFHSDDLFEQWLKNLPNILLGESLTSQTVDIILKFAATKNSLFNSVLKPKLLNIISNLPKLRISNCTSNSSYHKLLSLLYWIKAWNTESLNLLENQLLNHEYRSDHGKFIFDTLRLRSGGIL